MLTAVTQQVSSAFFSEVNFGIGYFSFKVTEVKNDTTPKKIYSSEKSRCSKQVPLIKIKRNALASFSSPVFLKVLNTEGV
jgi:hypothetical protein